MQAFSPLEYGAPVTPRELLRCDSETGDGGSSMEAFSTLEYGAPVTPRELLPCDSETGGGGSSTKSVRRK